MIIILPAACCLLSVIGRAFYPLSDKKVKEISEELNLRRNNIN